MENALLTSRKLEALSVVRAGTLPLFPAQASPTLSIWPFYFILNRAVSTTETNASLLAVRLAHGQEETFCVNTG